MRSAMAAAHERPRENRKAFPASFPGRDRLSRTQLRGIRLGHLPRVDHAVHVARAVRGLRRAAPAPGKPRRKSRRPLHRRIHRAGHFRRAPRRGRNPQRPHRAPDGHRRPRRSPKLPRGSISCSPSASATSAWIAPPPRFPAAKPQRIRLATQIGSQPCAACSTCSTSLPSACTRATMTA